MHKIILTAIPDQGTGYIVLLELSKMESPFLILKINPRYSNSDIPFKSYTKLHVAIDIFRQSCKKSNYKILTDINDYYEKDINRIYSYYEPFLFPGEGKNADFRKEYINDFRWGKNDNEDSYF